jgi:hypothetical protein
MKQTKIVLPKGSELLAANVDRINKTLTSGSDKVRLNMPDWYLVAYSVALQKGFIVHQGD